jgi:DNA invertase Pin-like site-specific DNA recombinase
VEDATVSGSVNLDERPSLGKWLQEPLVHEWDALMVTTQDRISRDDMHWWSFVKWVLDNSKTILILDDPAFDITTEDGRMIAGIKATQAAKYRKSVQEKKLKQTAHFREEELWSGGSIPFGYRPVRVEHNGRMRWRLAVDETTSALVREAYDRLVNHGHLKKNTMGAIVKDWNARGVLTSKDYQAHLYALEGRTDVKAEVKGTRWATSTLKAVLSNPSLMGYAKHKGDILKKDGLPVKWADEILSPAEFNRLQEAMRQRGKYKLGLKNITKPLVGILFCRCGEPMYSNVSHRGNNVYYYFVCKSRRFNPCEFVASWPRSFLEDWLEDAFLNSAGALEITTKTFIPGRDNADEIETLQKGIDNLAQAIAGATNLTVIESLSSKMELYAKNLEALQAEPIIPSRWEEQGTGETYREWWNENPDWERRAELLKKTGIRLYCAGTHHVPDLTLYLPQDLRKRLDEAISDQVAPGFLADMDEWVTEDNNRQREFIRN